MTHPYQDLKEAAVERMARAWASIDGKADKFELCKRERAAEDKMGHYLGYLSDAEELAKRSGILSILADYERMREALKWYANPEVYKPHPNGLAFDRRDLSYHARAADEETP